MVEPKLQGAVLKPHPSSAPSRAKGTPIAFVNAVLQAISERGMATAPVLEEAHITPVDLRRSHISPQNFERLCAIAMRTLDDEALGWFERQLPWGSYGMLARASNQSPNLGVALARWCRHHGLLTQTVALKLMIDAGCATIRVHERRPLGIDAEFARVSLLRNLHGLACWWIDSRLPLRAARFVHAVPPHAVSYERLFPGPIEFAAAHTELCFDAAYLKLPLVRDEEALQRMLNRALTLMVVPYRRDRLLIDRLTHLLRCQIATPHTAASLARQLHVSVRSLHRQLHAEGQSLQALKDRIRREHAQRLLLGSSLPIAEVASATGFVNAKAFSRAFSHWTGMSPQTYRQRRGAAT